jgi:MFS transporter, DHA2 family, multidrug resistance protein
VGSARRWWALGALSLSLMAVGLDMTVLNTALPTLSATLRASTSQLQWFTDAYNLVLAAVLLPAGLLGDRFGRKKLVVAALMVFGGSSAWCAYSTSPAELTAARAALGVGASFLIPLCVSVLLVLFEPHERQRAVTYLMTGNMVGIPLGPIVAGLLLRHFWWGSVFLINVPLVLAGLIAVTMLVPESRNPRASRLDLAGVLVSAVGMIAVTYGVIEAGDHGWGSVRTLGPLAGGLAVLAAFVPLERRVARSRDPLVDIGLFRSRGFTWGAVLATLVSFALFGVLFNTPQYLQAVLGADALGTGLRLLPMLIGLTAGVQLANRIAPKTGPKIPVALGFAGMAAGLLAGATTSVGSGYGFTAAWLVAFGIGLGLAMPTSTMAAVGSLGKERSGAGSATVFALRQLGSSIGVAILGTLVNSSYRAHVAVAGLPAPVAALARTSASSGAALARRLRRPDLLASVRAAFVHGMDIALWVCGGLGVLSIVLALAFLPGLARPVVADASGAGADASAARADASGARAAGEPVAGEVEPASFD